MSALGRKALSPRVAPSISRNPITSPAFHGRTATYRRISTQILNDQSALRTRQNGPLASLTPSPLRSQFLPSAISTTFTRSISFKEMQKERQRERAGQAASKPQEPKQSAKPEPEPAKASEKPKEKEYDAAEEAYRKAAAEEGFGQKKAEPDSESAEGEAKPEGEGAEGQKKKDNAPPPKHGSKTPWQVFTETLQTEFKASKEWNDSQQQLQGSIHDFSQNPNVQKAKSAYSKATETASTTTSAALKSTAGVIGSSAAWTWDTTVVKGVRKSVTAVGSGLEKATRPVRETEAYKNVKDVIDDGSSSRYGGWVEKEERRKRREAKELEEIANGTRKPTEPMEEDPKSVFYHTTTLAPSNTDLSLQRRCKCHSSQRCPMERVMA